MSADAKRTADIVVVLVTAPTRGTGLAIVKKRAKEGAAVYMAALELIREA